MSNDSPLPAFTLEYPDAELVFGIVCAVGTDYRPVVDYLKNLLKRAQYDSKEYKVSDYFPELATKLQLDLTFGEESEYQRIDTRMRAGNAIRGKTQDSSFMALDVASRIHSTRPCASGNEPEALPHSAHIIISLKREEEVQILRKIYGAGFYLIGIFSSESERRDYLETEKGIYDHVELTDLINRDQRDEDFYGQRTKATFEHADVFVTTKDSQFKAGIKRFVHLVFGDPYSTPTRDEYGMFFAYSASARSGALARQVGAAILSRAGDLLAVGCNDVPSPDGGLYWEGDSHDWRDHKAGGDSNDEHKKRVVEEAGRKLEESLNAVDQKEIYISALKQAVSSAIKDITEFGRTVHAEMDAITTCARIGVSIAGTILFTTTFPCHNCTRHIIAAGIKKVVYIEPYPKSQAGPLHGDAISFSDTESDGKIPFIPFVGIGPRRFFDLFSLKVGAGYEVQRKIDGRIVDWRLETHAKPRVPMAATSYIQREQLAFNQLKKIYSHDTKNNGEVNRSEDGAGILEPDANHSSPSRKLARVESGRNLKSPEDSGGDAQTGALFR